MENGVKEEAKIKTLTGNIESLQSVVNEIEELLVFKPVAQVSEPITVTESRENQEPSSRIDRLVERVDSLSRRLSVVRELLRAL
jgi:archaellum component FlaC